MRIAWLVACVAAAPAAADEIPRNATSGLGLAAGLGSEVAGIGGEVLYYAELGSGWRIVPRVGGGVLPSDDGTVGGVEAGIAGEWGARHRILLDVSFGLAGIGSRKRVDTGEVVEVHPVYGPTIALGYEYVADGGFLLRISAGVTYVDSVYFTTHVGPAGTLALGYKLW
jgi:hypothetical protein